MISSLNLDQKISNYIYGSLRIYETRSFPRNYDALPAIICGLGWVGVGVWGVFQNDPRARTNLIAPKFSHLNKLHIFHCIGKTFCVEFQSNFKISHKIAYPYTHTLKMRFSYKVEN